ncbi:hypothetical protein ES703_106396 [subsurface metagenome]
MPRIFDLGEYHEKLTDVHLIIGEGLCSNIYVIGREEACVVDPGVGNSALSLSSPWRVKIWTPRSSRY